MTDQPANNPSELSFDRAIPVTPVSLGGSATGGAGLTCVSCKRAISETYHTANGEPICENCRVILGAAVSSATSPALLGRAVAAGFGAMLAGAFLYWAAIKASGREWAIVAILSGWLIGQGLRRGAGGRGGRVLQVTGALLVYLSIATAYFALIFQPGQSAGESVASLAAIALLMPLNSIFGSGAGGLISALIIGFGMMQAWQQVTPHEVLFEGPFRVGGAAA